MDFRLFLSTFVLIFLAELGDKTQLAAMAQSSTSKAPWSVFAGAATALVCSTLIAVLIGSWVEKNIPKSYINGAAGFFFLVFGCIFIYKVIVPGGEKETAAVAPAGTGILARIILESACEFEKASGADYRELSGSCGNEKLRKLFLSLAEEEDSHLAHLHELLELHGGEKLVAETAEIAALAVPELLEEEKSLLAAAVRHENQTADFYAALAEKSHISPARKIFLHLAAEEREHARRLSELAAG